MKIDFRFIATFIAAIIIYFLLLPELSVIGILVVAAVSGGVVYGFTTRGFNKVIRQQIRSRDYRAMVFHFFAAFVAFSGADLVDIASLLAGLPVNVSSVAGIIAFIAIFYWLNHKVFPTRVAPRLR